MSDRTDYLQRIVPAVRRRLEERRAGEFLAQEESAATVGARPSFAEALGVPGISLIAEIKRASPSKGPIRPDLDVAELAQAYEKAGASAVSVLTEEDFFKGGLGDLRVAAGATALPLLRKDFIIDEYQVREAKACGASALLLIAALLDDSDLRALAGVATDLGLDVLLEVHDASELERALGVEGAVIGVNNRDLRTFEVSLETTLSLAQSVPAGRLLVSESGIRSVDDVGRLAAAGVDAVLVGEHLLVEGDVSLAVRGLMGGAPSVATRPVGRVG